MPKKAKVRPVENPAAAPVRREISWGVAGLVLVSLRLLQLAQGPRTQLGDAVWFVSSVGVVAALVGLVVCIAAIAKNSGRGAGVAGVVLFALLALFFLYQK